MKKKQEPDISQILKELQRSYLGKPNKKSAAIDDESDTSDAEFQKQLSSMLAGFSEPSKKKATKKSAPPKKQAEDTEIDPDPVTELGVPSPEAEIAPQEVPISVTTDASDDTPVDMQDDSPVNVLDDTPVDVQDKPSAVSVEAPQTPASTPKKRRSPSAKKARKEQNETTPISAFAEPVEEIVVNEAPVEPMEEEIVIDEAPVEPAEEEIIIDETPIEPMEEEIVIDEAPIEPTEEEIVIDEAPIEPMEEEIVIDEAPIEPTEKITVEGPQIEIPEEVIVVRPSLEPIDDSVDEPMPEPWKAPTVKIRGVTEQGYIKITPPAPKPKAEDTTSQNNSHANVIVIRPPASNVRPSEPIVIRPRGTSKATPAPAAHEDVSRQEPIKIGKEV